MDFNEIEKFARIAKEAQKFLAALQKASYIDVRAISSNGSVIEQVHFGNNGEFGEGSAVIGAIKKQLTDEQSVRLQQICREVEKLDS